MKVQIEVTDQMIADVLTSGLEGGVGYWSQIQKHIKPKSLDFRIDKEHVFEHIDFPMNKGGAIVLKDLESNKNYTLTLPKLRRAVKLMASGKYKHHFNDMINENSDAITGDVLIQLAVLGDVIYG